MVGQARKGLNADDVGNAGLDEFDHLARQEPPFAVLVADGEEGLGLLRNLPNRHRGIEPFRFSQSLQSGLADAPDQVYGQDRGGLTGAFGPQEFHPVLVVEEAVVHKIHQIGDHSLRTLPFQQLHQMVVGQGHILDQDLAHHTHTGLFQLLMDGKCVKISNDLPTDALVSARTVFGGQCFDALFLPALMQGIGRAGDQLVGPHPVQAAHQKVAIDDALDHIDHHAGLDLEALVFLHAVGVEGDHRNLGMSRLFQGSSDKSHIVAGTAAAAGLGHDDGQFIGVVFTRQHRLHDLAHHRDGGEAGIVVDKFQSRVDGAPVVVIKNDNVKTVLFKHRFQKIEMNGTHLRCQNGVALVEHPLGEHLPFIGGVVRFCQNLLLPAHIHGSQQGADPDANGT